MKWLYIWYFYWMLYLFSQETSHVSRCWEILLKDQLLNLAFLIILFCKIAKKRNALVGGWNGTNVFCLYVVVFYGSPEWTCIHTFVLRCFPKKGRKLLRHFLTIKTNIPENRQAILQWMDAYPLLDSIVLSFWIIVNFILAGCVFFMLIVKNTRNTDSWLCKNSRSLVTELRQKSSELGLKWN